MQLLLTLSALFAAASASTIVQDDGTSDYGFATVVNRCPYDVYLWSVHKQLGCPSSASTLLKKGDTYKERMKETDDGGVSIKISKFANCAGKELSQLEYNIVANGKFAGNYLDMSFVDCQKGGDCPGWHDGFYFQSGNDGKDFRTGFVSAVNNQHCPIFNVANAIQAAKVSYVLPDDVQTKYCDARADMALYLCGSQAPSDSDNDDDAPSSRPPSSSAAPTSAAPSSPKPSSSSSSSSSSSQVKPSTTQPASKPATSDLDVLAAAITPSPKPPKAIKTVVTYVTEYVDAPIKRHAHGRRHKQLRA